MIKIQRLFLALTSFCSLVAVTAALVAGNTSPIKPSKASTYAFSLNASNKLISEDYVETTKTYHTESGGDLIFGYKDAKGGNDVHALLGRVNYGANDGNEGYLENKSPITGVESISLQFVGTKLDLYVSADGNEFSFSQRFTYNNEITTYTSDPAIDLTRYYYFRFVNSDLTLHDASMVSLTFNYNCSKDNLDLEKSDRFNYPATGQGALTPNASVFDNGKSTNSYEFVGDGTDTYINIRLGQDYNIEDGYSINLSFYANFKGVTAVKNKTYSRPKFYAAYDSGTGVNIKTHSGNNTSTSMTPGTDSWVRWTFDLSTLTLNTGKTGEINTLRLGWGYLITGTALLDHLQVSISAPVDVLDYTYSFDNVTEDNDLSNGTYTSCYGGTTDNGIDETYFVAPVNGTSSRSRKTTISDDWKMWRYAGMEADLRTKVMRFDVYFETITDKKSPNLILQIQTGESVLKTDELISKTADYFTRTEVTDGSDRTWYRITIDCYKAFADHRAELVTTSANLGFNMGYARIAYIDNLQITNIVPSN